MAVRAQDKYANILNASCTPNGTTEVATEISTGVSLGEGKGMLIDEIDYNFDATVLADFIAGGATDYLVMSLSVQSDEFGANNSRVIHEKRLYKWEDGTPANSFLLEMPMVNQFFPPMIIAAPKLYFNVVGSAGMSGGDVFCRVFYRYVNLTSQEYLELAESFVLIS